MPSMHWLRDTVWFSSLRSLFLFQSSTNSVHGPSTANSRMLVVRPNPTHGVVRDGFVPAAHKAQRLCQLQPSALLFRDAPDERLEQVGGASGTGWGQFA